MGRGSVMLNSIIEKKYFFSQILDHILIYIEFCIFQMDLLLFTEQQKTYKFYLKFISCGCC